MRRTTTLLPMLAVAGLLVLVLARETHAGTWLPSLSGASSFGGAAFADSTVNFATYSNDGDWVDDLGANATITLLAGSAIDRTAPFVLFYQVDNTNPQGDGEGFLDSFSVAVTTLNGQPDGVQPYTSGGYDNFIIDPNASNIFGNADLNAAIDPTPNDGSPSRNFQPGPPFAKDSAAVDPISLTLTSPNDFAIANPAVNGGVGYTGAQFSFASDLIGPGERSTILFLTTNQAPSFVWAETTASFIGGPQAVGDVVGVATPEPSAFGVISVALLGMAGYGWRRRKRQQPA